jgi:hypothetical protein
MDFAQSQGLVVSHIKETYDGAEELQELIEDYLVNFTETSEDDVKKAQE